MYFQILGFVEIFFEMLWDLFFMNTITRFLIMFIFAITCFFAGNSVYANTKLPISDASAQMGSENSTREINNSNKQLYIQKLAITRVLNKYNSPLIDSVDTFIGVCTLYNIDCYLVPAIAGIESTFGLHTAYNTNNPFGWGGGYMRFESWDDAIYTVAKGLKTKYIARGATTVESIGRIYAPPSTTWAGNVTKLMSRFRMEEEYIQNNLNIL